MATSIPLVSVQYQMDGAGVTLIVRHPTVTLMLTCPEADLTAALPAGSATGANWGNAEAVHVAQALIDARFPEDGFVVVPEPAP